MGISIGLVNVLGDTNIVKIITASIVPFIYFLKYVNLSRIELNFIPLYKKIYIYLSLALFSSIFFTFATLVNDQKPITKAYIIELASSSIFVSVLLVIATLVSINVFSISAGIKYEAETCDTKFHLDKAWKFYKFGVNKKQDIIFYKENDGRKEYRYIEKKKCKIIEKKTFLNKVPTFIFSSEFNFWITITIKVLLMIIFLVFLKEEIFLTFLLLLFISLILFSSIIILLKDYILAKK